MANPIIQKDNELASRLTVVTEAACQIEGLCDMIRAEIARINVCETSGMKAAVLKIRDLSGVAMRAADDGDHDFSGMHRDLHGNYDCEEMQHG